MKIQHSSWRSKISSETERLKNLKNDSQGIGVEIQKHHKHVRISIKTISKPSERGTKDVCQNSWETWSSYFFENLIFYNIQSILADNKHINWKRLAPASIFGAYYLKILTWFFPKIKITKKYDDHVSPACLVRWKNRIFCMT